jgi:hypothetical protein
LRESNLCPHYRANRGYGHRFIRRYTRAKKVGDRNRGDDQDEGHEDDSKIAQDQPSDG